jgi:hypothetical protein
MKSVCVLGGNGVFGRRIVEALRREGIRVIVAGRSVQPGPDSVVMDASQDITAQLRAVSPFVVINTCGPFQGQDYHVARSCIELGIHCIDLADGRAFVTGIGELDQAARKASVAVITGASTVPGLSSAVIERFRPEFSVIEQLDFGITPGAKTPRGVATAQSILSYIGRPLQPFAGGKRVYGWQDMHRVKYPELGYRWMGNCEVPDLDLLPQRYGIQRLRFSAGMESTPLHLGIWGLSWLIRLGLRFDWRGCAKTLARLSHCFDCFGSHDGGMHVILQGKDTAGQPLTIKWFMVVKNGEGPYVPTIPSVVLAKKLIAGECIQVGAKACVGLVSLDEYLAALSRYAMHEYVERLR